MPKAGALEIARHNMVEYQIRCCKILNTELLDVLESMPREDYVPQDVRSLAYMEGHVPIDCGQEMLSPLQEANIMQQLQLKGHERILEIGTGTGYLTTLLAMYADDVTSCELHEPLATQARKNIAAHGIDHVQVIHINAMHDKMMQAHDGIASTYDVIILAAALQDIPQHIKDMVADGGQLIAFIGKNSVVTLTHYQRQGDDWIETGLCETLLPDMEELSVTRQFIF
ncbi:MAG: protein-L-isoaspartate O-methyltransferase [Mariprofundaceae bacterium]|nr:protein-L-isoaspartate O-methyltransferase [Mariprofundaceae bacterium]